MKATRKVMCVAMLLMSIQACSRESTAPARATDAPASPATAATPAGNSVALFRSSASGDVALTPKQRQVIAAISQQPATRSVKVVALAPTSGKISVLAGGAQSLTLLDEVGAVRLKFEGLDVRKQSEDFSWLGSVVTEGMAAGNAVLVVKGGEITGTVFAKGRVVSIQPLGNGLHVIAEIDQTKMPPDEPKSFRAIESKSRPDPGLFDKPVQEKTACTINVLVLYTPAVEKAHVDMVAFAQSAIDAANLSYKNNGLQIQLKLAGVRLEAYEESGIEEDVERLVNTKDGFLDDVPKARDDSAADVVILLRDEDPTYCGWAADIFASQANAYAAVSHTCAVSNLSFPHEIGHLIGARHDPCADPVNKPFPWGHGYVDGKSKCRTVMAYQDCCEDCTRMPFWASPDAKMCGVVAGTAHKENDARVLKDMTCRVAAFRK